MIGLNHYLILSLAVFSIGIFGVLTRRSAIGVLLSLELMFNAVCLNFAAFSYFLHTISGQIMVIFIIAIAAAESCVGIALVLSIYRHFKDISVDKVSELKW
ncbi:MAG: NADH-quinone oxidoreductase subunit NuoK [Candidatus Eremiobacteraeota bacterium]|nr:NADH-quinone oxidoreductase subunit NuoK [Candidatus Eremiobacteraeota bacterium]